MPLKTTQDPTCNPSTLTPLRELGDLDLSTDVQPHPTVTPPGQGQYLSHLYLPSQDWVFSK